jgi:hypothetical protein
MFQISGDASRVFFQLRYGSQGSRSRQPSATERR